MRNELINSAIGLLRTTLGDIKPRDADKIVVEVIKILEIVYSVSEISKHKKEAIMNS